MNQSINDANGILDTKRDEEYFRTLIDPVRVCALYKPKLGQGGQTGISLQEFEQAYRADLFYNWVGMDSPLLYATHKAAGGMTSIYRQLGVGCERLFKKLLQNTLELSESDVEWQYQSAREDGREQTLSLDGRIELEAIPNSETRERLAQWLEAVRNKLEAETGRKGIVFEVRQGYKSKDSKRQNADLRNALRAYASDYVPAFLLFSNQIDESIALKYIGENCLVLRGRLGNDPLDSTYAFVKQILGYDLEAFFERNAPRFREELQSVLQTLLGTEA